MNARLVVSIVLLTASATASSWSGYDWEKGAHVEIEKGQLVRSGRSIEIYDYDAGDYKEVEVESIRRRGNKVEVEVFDSESGEYRSLEMDDE
ncbi:MAG: DUF5334 domain-containing protein [Burkholderiaceae bacterium]|nr:DUF5334 domain-containing protein [Burkholderiaceae bacterium]